MNRYNKYKSSGVNLDWLRYIPEHWELKKYKYLYRSNMGATILKENLVENGKIPVFSATESDSVFGYVDESSIILSEGDIVIPARGNSIGHIMLVKDKSTCTQTTIYSKKIHPELSDSFIFYYLKGNKDELFQFDRTAIPQITVSQIKENLICIPPIDEQTTIAYYLDDKTKKIDDLIEKKQKLIELLKEERTAFINQTVTKGLNSKVKLKSSGIELIGDIPENWELKKLKHLVSKIGSGVTPKGGAEIYLTEGIPLIRSQNVYFDGLRLDDVAYISEEIDNTMIGSRVFEGDVLLNITGGSIGRCYFVPKGFGRANVNQHVCIIRPSENILTEYLYFLISSNLGQEQINMLQTGANREGLNFEQLKSFIFPLPTIELQKELVTELKIKTSKSDFMISNAEKEIELLREYRMVLINEVVTGKIKVI